MERGIRDDWRIKIQVNARPVFNYIARHQAWALTQPENDVTMRSRLIYVAVRQQNIGKTEGDNPRFTHRILVRMAARPSPETGNIEQRP